MAGLVTLLATLGATVIIIHNAAHIDERRRVIALSRQMGSDNITIDPMFARQRIIASCYVSPTAQATPTIVIPLREQKAAVLLATSPGANAVAFSPDGKLLASAYSNGTVWLWSPVSGHTHGLVPMTSFRASADSVAFSPDGKLLASAYSNGTVWLWNVAAGQATGAPFRPRTGTQGGADSVAFSPDGKLLASAYSNGTVWLWNLATGRGMASTTPSPASADSVAFSPDGRLLASAYSDDTIRLWNPATGRGMVLSTPSPGSANAVAFSPDGKLLASAYSNGTVRLWNPATGQPAGAPLQVGAKSPGSVNGVAFSPDGKLLAGADSNGTLRLWNPPADQHDALSGGGPLITVASLIAIAVSALAAAITAREIHLPNRRLTSSGKQLWKFCY